ncbi:MAG: efflux RND transporter permease subunit [Deltaproteobacteria bacterium]|nr:efflux RND transporter permease subunit [Deltaproteobacteria bacterium]MBW2359303.1 efflux RND transporter permease subunit [Deltaproteobacteria bacterium]
MERLVRYFVERHLLVNILTVTVVVLGIGTALRTNIEGYPDAELPRFVVTANLPGASARDIETKVTIPIEDELGEIDGLENFTTVVTDNRSVTSIELDDDTPDKEIAEKEREISNALDAITDFPDDMRDKPKLYRFDPTKQPVLEVALSGDKSTLPEAARMVERALLRAEGVGAVNVVGLPDPELRVLVDPAAARAHGVTLLDTVRAIQRRNVSETGGVLESAGARRQVVMWGRFHDPFEVGDVILRFQDNGPLRVRDVARLELDRKDTGLIAGTNGRPGLSLIANKKPDADIVSTRKSIDRALAALTLPPGVTTTIVNDASYEMRNRLKVIASNGGMGVVLVATIVFLFLAPSAAIWVCAGVPLVILGVIAVMPHVGMTINFVSSIAFVIVLGMLVDDAVVVAEKILLRRQEGHSPADAAVSGTLSVARPVIASAATTLLAFAPMLAIGGMPSKLIWQVPAVVCIALALSLLESFLILPAHMSMVRADARPRPKRAFVVRLEALYRTGLERMLPQRGKVIAAFGAIFFLIVALVVPRLEFEFFPQDSSPGFAIKVTLPPGTSLEQTEASIDAIQAQLPALMGQDLIALTSRVGHQDTLAIDREYGSAENEGFISAHLVADKKQKVSAEWIEYLRDRLRFPENATVTFEAQVDGPPGLQPVMVYILANDDVLRRQTAVALRQYLESIDGVVDVAVDERAGMRQIDLNLDPERLAMRGLDAKELGLTLKAAFFGLVASEIRDLDETTEIRVQFEPAARRSLDSLLEAPVRNSRGELVLLRDVVSPAEIPALAKIQHRNGARSATVTAGFSPSSGHTSTTVAELLEDEFLPRYAGRSDIELEIGGEVIQSRRATGELGAVAVVVVIAIGAVIAIMLGSFLEAFFVIAVVPFSAAFVALTFFAHGMNFSLLPVIGTIGLAGVVVNASIVMVDSVHQAQRRARGEGEEARTRAMIDALVTRLRPVLVTSLSTFGGVMPTAYGLGGWDPIMSPMSLALGWGLALSSGVTLFLVPALYVTANDLNRALARWRKRSRARLRLEGRA